MLPVILSNSSPSRDSCAWCDITRQQCCICVLLKSITDCHQGRKYQWFGKYGWVNLMPVFWTRLCVPYPQHGHQTYEYFQARGCLCQRGIDLSNLDKQQLQFANQAVLSKPFFVWRIAATGGHASCQHKPQQFLGLPLYLWHHDLALTHEPQWQIYFQVAPFMSHLLWVHEVRCSWSGSRDRCLHRSTVNGMTPAGGSHLAKNYIICHLPGWIHPSPFHVDIGSHRPSILTHAEGSPR